jgi:hypothetical protein
MLCKGVGCHHGHQAGATLAPQAAPARFKDGLTPAGERPMVSVPRNRHRAVRCRSRGFVR